MTDHGSTSSRIHHFIRSHPKEIQPQLISLDDSQLLELMNKSLCEVWRALAIKSKDADRDSASIEHHVSFISSTNEQELNDSYIIKNQNTAQDHSTNNLNTPKLTPSSVSSVPSFPFLDMLGEFPFTEAISIEESFVDWRGPSLLNRQDFQAEFFFKALSLQPDLAVGFLLKQGKKGHPSLQKDILHERFLFKLNGIGFTSGSTNSQTELEGRRALAFADDVLNCWSQSVSEDSSLDSLSSYSRSSKDRRLAPCSQTVLKALNKNNITEAIPYMALLGHFVLRPPNEIRTSIEDDLPSLIDYSKSEIFKNSLAKPRFYRYREDLFWDCVILAVCFPLDCGLIRLTQHLNVSLPILSYTLQSDEVKRYWLRIILCLGALRKEIDIESSQPVRKLPPIEKNDKASLKKIKTCA